MIPGTKNISSGNGIASFTLNASKNSQTFENVQNLNFTFGDTPLKDILASYYENQTLVDVNVSLEMINITVSTLG